MQTKNSDGPQGIRLNSKGSLFLTTSEGVSESGLAALLGIRPITISIKTIRNGNPDFIRYAFDVPDGVYGHSHYANSADDLAPKASDKFRTSLLLQRYPGQLLYLTPVSESCALQAVKDLMETGIRMTLDSVEGLKCNVCIQAPPTWNITRAENSKFSPYSQWDFLSYARDILKNQDVIRYGTRHEVGDLRVSINRLKSAVNDIKTTMGLLSGRSRLPTGLGEQGIIITRQLNDQIHCLEKKLTTICADENVRARIDKLTGEMDYRFFYEVCRQSLPPTLLFRLLEESTRAQESDHLTKKNQS